MSDRDAFLAAIHDAPDDDAPRLVFADWLEENGEPERAEFIRVQMEMRRERERHNNATLRLGKLFLRQKELFSRAWADIARRCGASEIARYSRGFPGRLTMSAETFVAVGLDVVVWIGPQTRVSLCECAGKMGTVANQTSLSHVRLLTIGHGSDENRHSDQDVADFLKSPYLSSLHDLEIRPSHIDESAGTALLSSAVAVAIASSKSLTGLRNLNLSRISIGAEGLAALAGAPQLTPLRVLILSSEGWSRFDIGALLNNHHFANLESLVVVEDVAPAVLDQLNGHFGPGVIRARVIGAGSPR